MQKITIRLPEQLLERLENSKVGYESLSSLCRALIEQGLESKEQEQELLRALRQRNADSYK